MPMKFPSLEDVVTDEYLDFVIKESKWTSHGSDIGRYLEDMELESLHERPEALKHHLKTVYFPNRYRFIRTMMEDEFQRLAEDPVIRRAMSIPVSSWSDFKKGLGHEPIGVFWSVSQPECYGIGEARGVRVVVRASFNPDQVDWVETLRSRMDYDLGDDEEEIQLFADVVPDVIDFEFIHPREPRHEEESELTH